MSSIDDLRTMGLIPPEVSVEEIREDIRRIMMGLRSSSASAGQLSSSQIQDLITNLPRLTEHQITTLGHADSLCPICFTPFLALLSEEETAVAMDSPAHPIEELGVTRLAQTWQCGHVFCRRDISKWIQDAHDSCPTCRRLLVEPRTSSEAESAERDSQDTADPINDDPLVQAIRDQMSAAYAQMEGASPLFPDFGRTMPSNRPHATDNDRSEFSGMYS